MIRATIGIFSQGGVAFDADAQAFFDRVTTAGGSLSTTEQDAVNTLVVQMKADGIWSKMKAIYPMVGASAAACAQNLKSSSFTGSFSSGWTFASTGVTPNGSSATFNTGFNPLTEGLNANSNHHSVYLRTINSGATYVDIGQLDNQWLSAIYWIGGLRYIYNPTSARTITASNNNALNLSINTRRSSTDFVFFQNNSKIGINATATTISFSSSNVHIGSAGGASWFSPRQNAFASIGDGLTDTEAGYLYIAVQGFNQTLNRNVGPQVVSDADAQAYINRVYNAGGTLTNTEANAVNQLTIDMKADGLWTKMKAIYPMVGASAAACAQNLKSASFTGTFTSGWTFASTGATPNGTSAYANTFINQNTLTTTSNHLSVYGGTSDTTRIHYSQGAKDNLFLQIANYILSRNLNIQLFQSGLTSNSGLILASRSSLNVTKLFRNNVELQSSTSATTNQTDSLIILGAVNDATFATISPVSYSNGEIRFNSIGDGLTNTEASDLYTAVQAFQTTLNREITP